MAGVFYNDLRVPHLSADGASVTLASTYKALLPAASLPVLGANFFDRVGKRVLIRIGGRITTAATPGNVQFGILYGTGADANGVTVAQTGAVALVASQTNMTWLAQLEIHCRAVGSSGTLLGLGMMNTNVALIASTNQPLMIPATAPAASASVDLTSSSLILSPQMLRSGSTAETCTVHDFDFIVLN